MSRILRILLIFLVSISIFSFYDKASASTYITEDITLDTTWSISGSPYLVDNTITILPDVSLTIDSGVVIKFNPDTSPSVIVLGKVLALGTESQKIYFTSNYDDEFYSNTDDEEFCLDEFDAEDNPTGGQICESFDLGEPFPGDWNGFYFDHASDSILQNVVLKYAADALFLYSSSANFKNLNIENSESGLTAYDHSTGEFSGGNLANLGKDAIMLFNNSSLNIKDATISNIYADPVSIFNASTLNASNLTIQNLPQFDFPFTDVIALFNGSTLSIKNSNFEYCPGEACITFFNGSSYLTTPVNLSVEDTKFSGGTGSAFLTFGKGESITNIKNSIIKDFANYGVENYSTVTVNAENNDWGDKTGPKHATLNPDGLGQALYGNVDFDPWVGQEGPIEIDISDLRQYKSDGLYVIEEGDITNDSEVVFKTKIVGNKAGKLQVEVKENGTNFNGNNLVTSSLTNFGSLASVSKKDLKSGIDYKWRARAVTETGVNSEWKYFGESNLLDFKVRLVELYTQIKSPYPSEGLTDEWSKERYAFGDSGCKGNSIGGCGCAITSAVMVMRYHGVTVAQGEDVNPKNLNTWLINNKGYSKKGVTDWYKVAKYSGNKIKYSKDSGTYPNNFAILDKYLTKGVPVIAKQVYGKNRQHFIVIDNKLTSTYGVKDPAWYLTKTLNQEDSNHVKNYAGGFDGLRIYEPNPSGIASSAIMFTLGSPAELLITDKDGYKLGNDPRTGMEYNEITGGSYYIEGLYSPDDEETDGHDNKVLIIDEPSNGIYILEVIGTDTGPYSLNTSLANTDGTVDTNELTGETKLNKVDTYAVSYSGNDSAAIVSEKNEDKEADIKLIEKPIETPSTTSPVFVANGAVPLSFLIGSNPKPKVLGVQIESPSYTHVVKPEVKEPAVKNKIKKTKTKKKSTILKSEKQVSVISVTPKVGDIQKVITGEKKQSWFSRLCNKIFKKQND